MLMLKSLLIAAALLAAAPVLGQSSIATLRGGTPLDQNAEPPQIGPMVNSDIRQVRNYPDQPPLIPHTIENYQIDRNSNKCLTCHSRTAIAVSQAPMVSVTHFMNRDGQTLAAVTPRRFFCTQCHVPQMDAKPLVENNFVDVDEVLEYVAKQQEGSQ